MEVGELVLVVELADKLSALGELRLTTLGELAGLKTIELTNGPEEELEDSCGSALEVFPIPRLGGVNVREISSSPLLDSI